MRTADELITTSPFCDSYTYGENEFYGNTSTWEKNGTIIKMTGTRPAGQLRDLLNDNFRLEVPSVPVLFVPGENGKPELAMSLSFMEMQSAWVPILCACGVVINAGLGLGYYTLRIMEQKEVDKVIIFERNPEVVEAFQERFSHRSGFDKCEFVIGDARETMKGYTADFAFIDIYHTLLPDEIVTDIPLFCGNNEIEHYHPWAVEWPLLTLLFERDIDAYDLSYPVMELFRHWKRAQMEEDSPLSDLWEPADYKSSLYILNNLRKANQEWVGA